MKKLFFKGGKPLVLNVAKPLLKPDTVLVKTMYSFVSRGTELATIKQNQNSILGKVISKTAEVTQKITDILQDKGLASAFYQVKSQCFKKLEVGYSASGIIVSSASKFFREGDFVAMAGAGIATHGEYCLVPTNMLARLIWPTSFDQNKQINTLLQQASITPIAAIALQGLRRANLQMGEQVCIVGLGLLGLLSVQLAKLSGLSVIGIDPDESRRNLALKLGADKTFSSDSSWVQNTQLYSKRIGVDAVLITASTDNNSLLDEAINITRKKGKLIIIGDIKMQFSREQFYRKELDLLISCSYGPGRYDPSYEEECIDYPYAFVRWTLGRNLQYIADLIVSQKLSIAPLISSVFPIDKAKEAYDFLACGGLGVVFEYATDMPLQQEHSVLTGAETIDPNTGEPVPGTPTDIGIETETKIDTEREPITSQTETSEKILCNKKSLKSYIAKTRLDVALVGAGGFAKTILAPILKQLGTVTLQTVVDTNPVSAINFQETFGFATRSGDFEEVLACENIDLCVMTTPDIMHCNQALLALDAGKAVFVEKPMLRTWEEFVALQTFLNDNHSSFFTVDFNRSYAPMIKKISLATGDRITPLLINYRVNAGMVGKNENNGRPNHCKRLVGEICHFFELFLSLVGKPPIKMTVVFSDSSKMAFEENLNLTLLFTDGSIANLIYTSIANENLGKERGEFFWDRKAAVIEDYKSLVGYGMAGGFDQYDLVADKGHAGILSNFICAMKREDQAAISSHWSRYFISSWLSLKLEELLLQNGGTIIIDPTQSFV